jgi:hypothetical protein
MMNSGTDSQCREAEDRAYRFACKLGKAASIGDQLGAILKRSDVWESLPADVQHRVDGLLARWVAVVGGPARPAEREAETETYRPQA